MVNVSLPRKVAISLTPRPRSHDSGKSPSLSMPEAGHTGIGATFVQILGKSYFLQLIENLRRILLDYAQKRPCVANVVFKAAC
jgi:hypothetical protein